MIRERFSVKKEISGDGTRVNPSAATTLEQPEVPATAEMSFQPGVEPAVVATGAHEGSPLNRLVRAAAGFRSRISPAAPTAIVDVWRTVVRALQPSRARSIWVRAAVLALACPLLAAPTAQWSSLDPTIADAVLRAGLKSHTTVASNAPSSRFAAVARPLSSSGLVIAEDVEPARLRVRTARLSRGGELEDELRRMGADPAKASRILGALRPVFDPGDAREGDFLALASTDAGQLISFELQQGRDLYRLAPGPSGQLLAVHSEPPMERRVVTLGGVIQRSLSESLRDQGERPELVQAFADIFAWKIDFARETRPGDEYRLVYEKFYDRSGFARYGRILAAQYSPSAPGGEPVVAIFYEDQEGFSGYYTPTGTSLRGSLLRAPVNYTRISSRYTQRRLHPVHRVYKPHLAVDYAAPTGTPVWAAGDGEVIFKGWRGGLGRTVKIRHRNGYVSYYGHLSQFASNLRVGSQVEQKQVVGTVGMTGTATGPHLDYRLEYKGRFLDPLKVDFETDRAIPTEEMSRFTQLARQRLERLRRANPALLLEAAM